MRFTLLAALPLLALSACGLNGTDGEEEGQSQEVATDSAADPLASNDEGEAQQIPDSEPRPIMQAQVVLDRRGFGPGVIDGKMGISTVNAVKGFQEANGLEVTGKFDEATQQKLAQWKDIPATRVVTIPKEWGQLQFTALPEEPADQAKLEQLGYESLDEKLAERFHTTVEVLKMLNPGGKPAGMTQTGAAPAAGGASPSPTASPSSSPSASPSSESSGSPAQSFFTAGQTIRVPNIGGDRLTASADVDAKWRETLTSLGVGTPQAKVARIVVDKSEGWLKGYDAQDKLVVMFTVTTGSGRDPLPLGKWGITTVARNTPFAYNPELFWDVPDTEEKQMLPPGPNGPVGVAWIDLTKEHYGIHGTPEPQTIGRAQSHGCVRLTNWDVARLADMVSTETEVLFQA